MASTDPLAGAQRNVLLAALPPAEFQRIQPLLMPVELALGQTLYEFSEQLDHLYFPTTTVISLLYTTLEGTTAEMGLVGNDGAVGVALFLGGETTPNRAIAQIAGCAYKMHASVLQAEFARGGPLQHVLLRYTQALITQISQTAVCNRLHSVEQRLCRWLLLSHDRVPTDEIPMTQEFISHMLGVRREGVTVAAARLKDAGLIDYSRGHIWIRARAGLEAIVCECYGIVKAELDRLLGGSTERRHGDRRRGDRRNEQPPQEGP